MKCNMCSFMVKRTYGGPISAEVEFINTGDTEEFFHFFNHFSDGREFTLDTLSEYILMQQLKK